MSSDKKIVSITGTGENINEVEKTTHIDLALAIVEGADANLKVWTYLINNGVKTINDVPNKIKDEVEALLNGA